MRHYPIEALLRPPVELWSAAIALLLAVVAIVAPWTLMMTPGVAYGCAAGLLLFAWRRGSQAFAVLRYQRNLRRLRHYRMSAAKVPISHRKLFIGRGFEWTQKHTQRLRDTLRPEVEQYLRMGRVQQWARQKELDWEHTPLLRHAASLLSTRAWWNPLRPAPPVGGKPELHTVELNERNVWVDLSERVGHTLVLGTTRVGKTRFEEILVTQDIRRGDVVIVIDPKGDPGLLRRVYAEARRAGREDELYIFHLGYPELSARYNAIGNFSRMTEVATRIANQLPDQGNSAAFREFAWRFVNIIARALVALGKRPDYHLIRRYINDIEPLFLEYCRSWLDQQGPAGWRDALATIENDINQKNLPFALRGRSKPGIAMMRYLKTAGLYDPVADGLRSAFEYDKTYFDKIVSSLGPLMEKLTTGKVAELLAPDYYDVNDTRPIFEWMQVIRRRGIVYVGLDALSDTAVAAAVGNSIFADLVSVAGQIYKHGRGDGLPGDNTGDGCAISVHADEFNEVIGDEFIPLLNKAGGAHFQVTAYTQTWSDVEARIGNRAKAGQVAGNFNSLIMLRVKEFATAQMLTKQLRRVEIHSLMQVSGVDDSSHPGSGVDFSSRNEDRISVSEVPLITEADAMELPKGQAFALIQGGRLWKLRMPLPTSDDDPVMPDSLVKLAAEMANRYATGERWWIDTPERPAPSGVTVTEPEAKLAAQV